MKRVRLTACCGLLAVSWSWALQALAFGTPGMEEAHLTPVPNVLWIFLDDLNTRLGCYGDPVARTPHLDALAARSVRFDRAYCQYPQCNPSRVSMLTGRYPSATNVTTNELWFRHTLPRAQTLPQVFHDHGYQTVRSGKIYHDAANDALGDPVSWTWNTRSMRLRYLDVPPVKPEDVEGLDAARLAPAAAQDVRGDEQNVHRVRLTLNELDSMPFLMCLGIKKPHAPLIVKREYLAAFESPDLARQFRLPVDFASRPQLDPKVLAYTVRPQTDIFRDRDVSAEEALEATRAYYACVSFADDMVGRVLAALEADGQADRTIVVVVSDNGQHLGEKGCWGKLTLYEAALRVPLIVHVPEGLRAGLPPGRYEGVCPRPVELVDLYPTLLDLCGLKCDEPLDGSSLLPLLRDPEASRPNPAYSTMYLRRGRSARSERYRLTEWDEGQVREFYDLQEDPHEQRNLAEDPAHAAERRELQRFLDARRMLEAKQPTLWQLHLGNGSRARLEPEHGAAEEFAVHVEAVGGPQPWQVQVRRGWRTLVDGGRYALRMQARASGPREIVVALAIPTPPYDRLRRGRRYPLTSEWQQFEYEFTARRDVSQVIVNLDVGGEAGRVEFRSMSLVPLDDTAAKGTAPVVARSPAK